MGNLSEDKTKQQELLPTDVAMTAEVPQEKQKKLVKVKTKKGLRLRIGPSVDFEVLKILPDETAAEVLVLPGGVEVPGWALITVDGVSGWVKAEFLITAE